MLSVEVTLYAPERGGRDRPICDLGYACFCKIDPLDRDVFECRLNFYCKYPVSPGEIRRADMFLITGEDAETLFRKSDRIFLCEERIIGEARLYIQRRRATSGMFFPPLRISGSAEKFLESIQQRSLAG